MVDLVTPVAGVWKVGVEAHRWARVRRREREREKGARGEKRRRRGAAPHDSAVCGVCRSGRWALAVPGARGRPRLRERRGRALGPLGCLALVVLGPLELEAGALRALGGPAALPLARQHPLGGTLEPIPDARALLLGPELAKAVVKRAASRLHVDPEDLEAAIGGAVRRARRELGLEVGRVAGPRPDGLGVGRAQPRDVALDLRQHHLAVVQLAEDVLEVARAAPGLRCGPAEAQLGRLEDVPDALRGDPHVVLRLGARPGSSASGTNERSSSRRTRTIRAAFSASDDPGSSFLTFFAFIAARLRPDRPAPAGDRRGCRATPR